MTRSETLKLDDAAAMAEVHGLAFLRSEAWSVAAFNDLLTQTTTHAEGLFVGGRLQAFLVIQFVAGEAEILTLATMPEARQLGHAGQVLRELEQKLRTLGLNKWLLDVAADNIGAIAFYKKHGFQVDGRRSNYYKRLEGERVDAILMSKPVGGQITK